jgi:hypothetical protein
VRRRDEIDSLAILKMKETGRYWKAGKAHPRGDLILKVDCEEVATDKSNGYQHNKG